MHRSLAEHLATLERRIARLNQEIMQNHLTKMERNRLESEIRAAQLAVSYYRRALAIEHSLA